MKRVSLVGLIIFALAFMGCNKENDNLFYNKKFVKEIKEGRKEFAFYMARNYIPGASLAIAKDGEIIYSEGLGYASKDLEVPATRKTKFRIGETTELFTSLAYQKLIDNGVLQADSSVQYYYSGFPEKNAKITLDNLVNHSSGIRKPNENEKNDRGFNKSMAKGLELFKDDPLTFAPDMYQEVSIFNYNLLGTVMEKATGKKIKDLLHELVIDTLHLENTEIDNPFLTIKDRSDFFDLNMVSQVSNCISYDLRFSAPAQGLLSNAEDLVKLGNELLYSDYITDRMRQRLFTTPQLTSGLQSQLSNGWIIAQTRSGEQYYARSGSVKGGGSVLLIFPQQNLVFAATTNVTSNSDDIPIFNIAKHFLPENKGKQEESNKNEK